MISIIQEIKVEVSKPNFFQAIVAKQYDSNSRFLKATLVQNNKKIPVADTSTVTINARRNDGAEKSFKGEVNEDGTVTVPLAYWMLELNGTLECDISIFGADESKLTSTKFIVEVERASCEGGDVADSNKCDILILQGQNIVGSVNGKTGVVELSAEDVGAAPAGYGLGNISIKELSDISELDNLRSSGFYTVHFDEGGFITPHYWVMYALVTVDAYNYNDTLIQTLKGVQYDAILRRTLTSGEWGEWEWLNPPMESGIEYRTTERHNGKTKYKKMVSFGEFPQNSIKEVSTGIDANKYNIIGVHRHAKEIGVNADILYIAQVNYEYIYVNNGVYEIHISTNGELRVTAEYLIEYEEV